MGRVKCSCGLCKKEMQPRYLFAHVCTPSKKITSQICCFCGRISTTLNSAAQHLIRCLANPTRIEIKKNFLLYNQKLKNKEIEKPFSNQFTKARLLGQQHPMVSEETKKRLSIATKQWNEKYWAVEENKEKHRGAMRRAVADYPESYSIKNGRRSKKIYYDGIYFHSTWEVDFYKWCKASGVEVERNRKGFAYEWNGSRTYFPDFYLPTVCAYVEIKGQETDRDRAKWSYFTEKLIIVAKNEIDKIRKGCYNIFVS